MVKSVSPNSKSVRQKNTHNIRIGKWGEEAAARHLEANGYSIVVKNFRTPMGELDLIAVKDDETVIVEVKTRRTIDLGYPEEALTAQKASHLVQAAEEFMADRPDLPQSWRVDLIAIIGKPGDTDFQLEHFENVVTV